VRANFAKRREVHKENVKIFPADET